MSYMSDSQMNALFALVEASNTPKTYNTVEVNGHSFTFPALVLHWPVDVYMLMEPGNTLAGIRRLLGEQWMEAGVDSWSAADGLRLLALIMESLQ